MENIVRNAKLNDVVAMVDMLSDDALGQIREDSSTPLNHSYLTAFDAINKDPNNELMVMECEGQIVGMLQLTFISYLTHIGTWRCLIEGVRIHKDFRGQGLGADFFKWSIQRAKERQCGMIQLTSDKKRPEALKFYESLGFKASHEGFKLHL